MNNNFPESAVPRMEAALETYKAKDKIDVLKSELTPEEKI
jgi:hypothetical protein